MFRKRNIYLVLTDTHLMRFKNQARASETFPSIPASLGRANVIRHSRMSSSGSLHDLQSAVPTENFHSIPLNQVVAVYKLDDGKPWFSVEIAHLDESHPSAMTIQNDDPRESEIWLSTIRAAATKARLTDPLEFSPGMIEYTARALEQARDYDPNRFQMFKVVQRATKTGGRSSSDDLSKLTSNICVLAIGVYKIHIVPLPRSTKTASSASLSDLNGASHGITTLTSLNVQSFDDTFQLSFRVPFRQPTVLYLASSSVNDLALFVRQAADWLRPEWLEQPFTWNVPQSLDDELLAVPPDDDDYHSFDRTLTAYCSAYELDTSRIRYTVNHHCDDAPMFVLLPPNDSRRPRYNMLELLAIMRALRYNEAFVSISFRNVKLDILHAQRDPQGLDHVPWTTRSGEPLNIPLQEHSWLLVQEVQALALKSKRLRRLDFAYSLTRKPKDHDSGRGEGCGICEALFPLCAKQLTNVDWIILSGITLADVDIDFLYAAAIEKSCHFRAIELGTCGLVDQTMNTVLQAFMHQEATMESIDISGNMARLNPATLRAQLGNFGYIRKLNLSNMYRTSGSEPLVAADTLLAWRLETLELSRTTLNDATVEAIATYLKSPQSDTLRELSLNQTQLTGGSLALLLRAMSRGSDHPRNLHLYANENRLQQDHEKLAEDIGKSATPTHVTMQMIEYHKEKYFQRLVEGVTKNTVLKSLDVSKTNLPYNACEDTCEALRVMFAENHSLEEINLSGEQAHLEVVNFGIGLNHALTGLKENKSLQILRIEHQQLGLPGANTLASLLEANTSIKEVHCENNEINLQAFTVLVNSLEHNTTLLHLPDMNNDRAWSLRKVSQEFESTQEPSSTSINLSARSTMRRTLGAAMSGQRSFSGRSTEKQTAVNGYATEKEAKAAVASLSQKWDREVARLHAYLARNHNIAQGLPINGLDLDVLDEPDRRVSTDSLATAMRHASMDTTPTCEADLQLGSQTRDDANGSGSHSGGRPSNERLVDYDDGEDLEGALTMAQELRV